MLYRIQDYFLKKNTYIHIYTHMIERIKKSNQRYCKHWTSKTLRKRSMQIDRTRSTYVSSAIFSMSDSDTAKLLSCRSKLKADLGDFIGSSLNALSHQVWARPTRCHEPIKLNTINLGMATGRVRAGFFHTRTRPAGKTHGPDPPRLGYRVFSRGPNLP